MKNTSEVLNEIYSILNRADALRELNPVKRSSGKGEYFELDCPKCSEKGKAYIYSNGIQIICNRKDKCGETINLWDYVQKKNNLTNQETLQELARIAEFTLPELNEETRQKIGKAQERSRLLNTVLTFYRSQLFTKAGEPVLNYLINSRGYSKEEINNMELGFNPGYEKTVKYLSQAGFEKYKIDETLKYLKGRDDYPLVFPYRDGNGRTADLWGRLNSDLNDPNKYKPYTEASKSFPFYFDKARGLKDLIIVEGYFDAMIAAEKGLKGVIALGGSSLNKEQLEAIQKSGSKRIFIALDNDKAGLEGTEKAINLLNQTSLEVFVVTLPEGYKDPDELITKKGIESFSEAVKNAQGKGKWLSKRILCKHDLKSDIGRRNAIKESLSCSSSINDPIDKQDFLNIVSNTLDIPQTLLKKSIDEAQKQDGRERFKKDCEDLVKETSRLLESGDLEGLDKLLKSRKPTLLNASDSFNIKPYNLADLQKDLSLKKEGLKTGYDELDEMLRIPNEAITLVGARSSHGKTTFMLNLFLNLIEQYPDHHFYFFSYEETIQQIAVKLINILSGWLFEESKNLIQLEGYLKLGTTSFPMVEKGKKKYQELVESGRLRIIGEPYYIQQLSPIITSLKSKVPLGAVFIDYIQKIKNKKKFGTRQLELADTSNTVLETAKTCSIPIILGAQLGRDKESKDKVKLDNLRESGDLEQDANVVLGLFNPSMEKAQDEQKQLTDRKVDLKVTPLKNRNGIVNKTISLEFDRPLLKIKGKKTK